MLDLFEMMQDVQKNLDAIQKALDPDEGANFVAQYQKLVEQMRDHPERQDTTKQELLTLVNRHPPVVLLLHQSAPRLFALPTTRSEASSSATDAASATSSSPMRAQVEPTISQKDPKAAFGHPLKAGQYRRSIFCYSVLRFVSLACEAEIRTEAQNDKLKVSRLKWVPSI